MYDYSEKQVEWFHRYIIYNWKKNPNQSELNCKQYKNNISSWKFQQCYLLFVGTSELFPLIINVIKL